MATSVMGWGATAGLPGLAGIFVAMLAAVPLFGYVTARFPRRQFLPLTRANAAQLKATIKGITIVANERYNRADTSVTGQVLKIVAAKPDASRWAPRRTQPHLSCRDSPAR